MSLQTEILQCEICKGKLPFDPKPILKFNLEAKIAIIGHAPGIKAHEHERAFSDRSGDTLRAWLGVDNSTFYQEIAIIPMGFCYPGKGKTGDNPPRKECAPQWHDRILRQMKNLELTIYLGAHAQNYYLDKNSLTRRVENFSHYFPEAIPLPHPSPRNNIWQKKHPWFQKEVLPELKKRVKKCLS